MMITMMTVKTMHDDHLGPPCDQDRLFPCTSLCLIMAVMTVIVLMVVGDDENDDMNSSLLNYLNLPSKAKAKKN